MDKTEYQINLLAAMKSCDDDAIKNIREALAHWPEKATGFHFDTFLDQDEEAFVSILITAGGPDSYVLNKQISAYRNIFDVRFIDGKLTHDLPLLNRDETSFDIREAVSETAYEWVISLFLKVGKISFPVPVRFSNCDHESQELFGKKKNKGAILTQFWVGKFTTEALFHDFVDEDPAHYAEVNEDQGYPISKFAASQGESYYDHDFMEVAFSPETIHTSKQFMASWSDQWADELDRRIKNCAIPDVNALIMMIVDTPSNHAPYYQVTNPLSFSGKGFDLFYMGEIEYDTHDK